MIFHHFQWLSLAENKFCYWFPHCLDLIFVQRSFCEWQKWSLSWCHALWRRDRTRLVLRCAELLRLVLRRRIHRLSLWCWWSCWILSLLANYLMTFQSRLGLVRITDTTLCALEDSFIWVFGGWHFREIENTEVHKSFPASIWGFSAHCSTIHTFTLAQKLIETTTKFFNALAWIFWIFLWFLRIFETFLSAEPTKLGFRPHFPAKGFRQVPSTKIYYFIDSSEKLHCYIHNYR